MTGFRLAISAASKRPRSPHRSVGAVGRSGAALHRPGTGLLVSGLAAACLIAAAAGFAQPAAEAPTDAEILALMKAHCVQCHAAEPTHEAFARAPAGVLLETIAQISGNASRILTQVTVTRAMPLGNETGMTDQERERIAAWIEGRPK
jgi:uncharacterized membrane protein